MESVKITSIIVSGFVSITALIGFFFGKEGLINYFVIIGVLIGFFILMLISIMQRY